MGEGQLEWLRAQWSQDPVFTEMTGDLGPQHPPPAPSPSIHAGKVDLIGLGQRQAFRWAPSRPQFPVCRMGVLSLFSHVQL